MGCGTNSKPIKAAASDRGANPVGVQGAVVVQSRSYKQIINNKSPHIRLDHSAEAVHLPMDGKAFKYDMKYVYVSQRGYYPNSLGKANQDSYLICESFLGDPNTHLFGIFDGHGECGDLCSHFAADMFPSYLEKELKANGGVTALEGPKMESILTKAFVSTNKAMHRSTAVDDTLSGTTGIVVIIYGDLLICANVGDSRAITATEVDSHLKFGALSNDQTPFRKDERERVKNCGARVMPLEQIEGNEPIHENWGEETGDDIDESGDPPRIWDHTLERPGCAFTRSIGDSIAEVCGVFAEPEIMSWRLSAADKFAVVASDGVFEFITSQGVVDLMSKFQNSLDGAKHIVAESYRLWLTYDDRTDDISLIVIDFENLRLKDNAKPDSNSNRALESQHHLPAVDSKPVRKVMSKAKRKVISENWDKTDDVEFDFAANATPKTPEELARIAEMVKANFMFQNLSHAQKDSIFKVMTLRDVKEGELIIKEGAAGDEMYVIDRGEFTVHKKDDSGVSQLVFTYTQPGAAFGELSLMYGKPRAASVKAKTGGRLWSIGRQVSTKACDSF
jgi:serine/threonine protein phosphatase PrpC